MLPDFLAVKKPLQESLNRRLQELVDKDPRISGFSRTFFFEGDRWSQGGDPASPFRGFRVPTTLSEQLIIERGFAEFEDRLEEWAEQHVSLMTARMREVMEAELAAGNPNVGRLRVDCTFEEYLDFLRHVEVSFDSAGVPQLPTPEVPVPELERRVAGWLSDPALRPQYDEVIAAKRENWNARESHRKLVD